MEKDNSEDFAKSIRRIVENATDEELNFLGELWKHPPELLKIDVKKAMYADKHSKLFSKEIPNRGMKIKDNDSSYYIITSSPEEYYNNHEGQYVTMIDSESPFDHSEIITSNNKHKLYITLPGNISDDLLEQIADKFIAYVKTTHGKIITYDIRKDLKKREYDIIIPEIYVENVEESKKIICEFSKTLHTSLRECLSAKFLDYGNDPKKPTILSKYHDSEKKNELGELIKSTTPNKEKILQIVNDSFYGMLDLTKKSQYPHVIIQNITNIQSQHNGDHNVKITPNDKVSENIMDFINHIKNDKPEWYNPDKFIPKLLIAEKFNEKYDEYENTRSFWKKLDKLNLKNILVSEEKQCRMSLNGGKNKPYRCFKPKQL